MVRSPRPADVHRPARGEVDDPPVICAGQAPSWGSRPSPRPRAAPPARAAAGQRSACEGSRVAPAPLQHRRHDLGDDLAGALDDDRVAHAHVLAADVVLVVQRGQLHHHAADLHRLEHARRG